MKRHLSVKLVMLHHPIFNLCRGNKINQRLSRKCPQNYANKLLLLLLKKNGLDFTFLLKNVINMLIGRFYSLIR